MLNEYIVKKNKYIIRPFMEGDMDKICQILTQIVWAPQFIEGEKRSIKKLISDAEGGVFIAAKDDAVLGFIQAQHLLWNRLSYVHGLVVAPHCRRDGIAGQLMAHVEAEAKVRGNRGVFLDTPVDNQGGRAFYLAQGYAEADTMPNYYEEGLDGVTYLKLFKEQDKNAYGAEDPGHAVYTKRLRLIPGTASLAKAAITDKTTFSRLLNATVPESWPLALLKDAEPFFAEMLEKDPLSAGWWIWYITLQSDLPDSPNILIGNSGFKGPPSSGGVVEIMYSILEEFQGYGYGIEAVSTLIDWAFHHPDVQAVAAETFSNLPASLKVMEKCGMEFMGPGSEEGTVRYYKCKSLLPS